MKIKKRNGILTSFDPSKILKRLRDQSKGLSVDFTRVAIEVQQLLYDGITTLEIDEEAARIAASYIPNHPDYSMLASKLISSRLQKELSVTPWLERVDGYVRPDIIEKYNQWLTNENLSDEVDYSFDYFGINAFMKVYSLKNDKQQMLELPHEMYMRAALELADTKEEFFSFYEEITNKRISLATPVLLNAGTFNPSMISCSLNVVKDDSLEGLHDTVGDIIRMSKDSAGIGLNVTPVRSAKTNYSNKGKAGGLVKYLKIINENAKFYRQFENRRGSLAAYCDLWHRDIVDFLNIRNPHGTEETTARDLFTAVVIPDLFYKRLQEDGNWSLFCPHEVTKYLGLDLTETWGAQFEELYHQLEASDIPRDVMSAKELMLHIVNMQAKSGTPYVWNKDRVNMSYNQSNYGVCKSSNLCVTGDTLMLTNEGYLPIADLQDEEVVAWNGKQWSNVIVRKTAENQELVKVVTNSGQEITCTPYHKFYVQENYSKNSVIEKRAYELKPDDKLIKFELPVIEGNQELEYAYDNGFYSGDGCRVKDKQRIYLYHDKRNLAKEFTSISSWYNHHTEKRFVGETTLLKDKFFVPDTRYTIDSRLTWLAGICDSDGTLTNNDGSQTIQIASVEKAFLQQIQIMLQTLGVTSKITIAMEEGWRKLPANDGTGESKDFFCKESYRLFINGTSLYKLHELGLSLKRLTYETHLPNRECSNYIKVKEVYTLPYKEDVYCAYEPLENKLMFNGILTGNCIEIINYHDKDNAGQCCLGSMVLPSFVKNKVFDEEQFMKSVRVLTVMLNKIIDKNKWSTPSARRAGLMQRSIAIGIAGLADFMLLLDKPFYSEESLLLNKRVQALIYLTSVYQSSLLTQSIKVPNKIIDETPLVNGKFHFEHYENSLDGLDDLLPYYEKVRKSVLNYGAVNSLFVANMPTASTSILLSVNEAFEPLQDLIFSRQTVSGEYTVVNRYLVKDLEQLGLWNEDVLNYIIENSSIQELDYIPQRIREKYLTIWEIGSKKLIDLAAARQPFVDQSQSMNLYWEEADANKMLNALLYGWTKNLKTGVYYTKVKPKLSSNKNLAIKTITPQKTSNDNGISCFGCST